MNPEYLKKVSEDPEEFFLLRHWFLAYLDKNEVDFPPDEGLIAMAESDKKETLQKDWMNAYQRFAYNWWHTRLIKQMSPEDLSRTFETVKQEKAFRNCEDFTEKLEAWMARKEKFPESLISFF